MSARPGASGPRVQSPAGSPSGEAVPSAFALDKRQVRSAFERAARDYDAAARVPRELSERLLEHLEPVRIEPVLVLDLGAGSGDLARTLSRRYRRSKVVAVDFAEGMLRVARGKARRLFSRQRFVCGDAEALPVADRCVDLVVSNAALPWCNAPDTVFVEVLRALKPGGLFLFSTLGPDTLRELRQGFAAIDPHPRVHGFIDMHDLGDALLRAGFADVVMDTVRLTADYDDVGALLRELKAMGATNALAARPRGLLGRGRLDRLAEAYEAHRRDGMIPASVEAVFAHAWKPERSRSGAIEVAPPGP